MESKVGLDLTHGGKMIGKMTRMMIHMSEEIGQRYHFQVGLLALNWMSFFYHPLIKHGWLENG